MASSQLEAYLENFGIVESVEPHLSSNEQTDGKICPNPQTLGILLKMGNLFVCCLIRGITEALRDVSSLLNSCFDSMRRLEVLISTGTLLIKPRKADRGQSLTLRYFYLLGSSLVISYFYLRSVNSFWGLQFVSRQLLWIALILATVPASAAYLLNHLTSKLISARNISENLSADLLTFLKRVQISSMGRQLSHPLPPITRIEEAAVERHGDIVLACPELRTALCGALIALSRDINAALESFNGLDTLDFAVENKESHCHTTQGHAGIERIQAEVKCIESIAFVSDHKDNLLSTSQLNAVYRSVFSVIIPEALRSIYESCTSLGGDGPSGSGDSQSTADTPYTISLLLHQLSRAVALPFLIVNVTRVLNSFTGRLRAMCRELDRQCSELPRARGNDTVQSKSTNDSNTHQSSAESASDSVAFESECARLYSTARVDLLRLRLQVEGIFNKIWLAEYELANLEATKLLVPSNRSCTINTDSAKHSEIDELNKCSRAATCPSKGAVIRIERALDQLRTLESDDAIVTSFLNSGVDAALEHASASLKKLLDSLTRTPQNSHSTDAGVGTAAGEEANAGVSKLTPQSGAQHTRNTSGCFESVAKPEGDTTINVLGRKVDDCEDDPSVRVVDIYSAFIPEAREEDNDSYRGHRDRHRGRDDSRSCGHTDKRNNKDDDFIDETSSKQCSTKQLLQELHQHMDLLSRQKKVVERVKTDIPPEVLTTHEQMSPTPGADVPEPLHEPSNSSSSADKRNKQTENPVSSGVVLSAAVSAELALILKMKTKTSAIASTIECRERTSAEEFADDSDDDDDSVDIEISS